MSTLDIKGFPPLVGAAARVLILGTIPGEVSLREQEYYAHPRNCFWPFMAHICGAGRELPYAARVEKLTQSGIAVWNVYDRCQRRGSLDGGIRAPELQDVAALFRRHPVRQVFFNGQLPAKIFSKQLLPDLQRQGLAAEVVLTTLPSTSPAYATMRFDEKRAAWLAVKEALAA